MKIELKFGNDDYQADLTQQHSIAITLLPNGDQPSHFGVAACTSETIIEGDFIGDTSRGGSCNCNLLTMTPHCNGTHTESISHIINQDIPVYDAIENSLFAAVLISVEPQLASQVKEKYLPAMDATNKVVTRSQLIQLLSQYSDEQLVGLAIRTSPNPMSKKSAVYNVNNYPVYLTNDAMSYIRERGIKHLMVDFPSVDKMYDDGTLSNHRIFWNVAIGNVELDANAEVKKSITEMIFVDQSIQDGFYLCNLQIPEIETDAVPSRPVLYQLNKSN
jgi:kynurenine formamidase